MSISKNAYSSHQTDEKGTSTLEERKSIVMQRYRVEAEVELRQKKERYLEWFTIRRETSPVIQRKARINYTNKLVKQRQDYKTEVSQCSKYSVPN